MIFRLAFILGVFAAQAQDLDSLPAYQPRRQVSGLIRIWGHGAYGHDYIDTLVKRWEEAFQKQQPGVRFENKLMGTASAIGALYSGTGDLALLGREIWPSEIAAFREIFHYDPLGIEILTGGYDVRNRDFAMTLFVHKDNPLKQLTLDQMESIFSAGRASGMGTIRSWGQLGLSGEWTDRPIQTYGFGINRGFAYYIEQTVFHGNPKWNPSMREYSDEKQVDGSLVDAGKRVTDALALDRYGIAYASMLYANPQVRVLALAKDAKHSFIEPTKESVYNRSYPLTRVIPMFLNRTPGKPVTPALEEFLRFILGREAQRIVAEDNGYLPLTPKVVLEQLRKLQ